MFTLTWILEYFYFTVSLLACALFAGYRLPRRKYFAVRLSISVLVLIGIVLATRAILYTSALVYTNPLHSMFYFVQYITVIFIMWICFDCNFWAALFCATVGYCIEHTGERFYEILKMLALYNTHIIIRGLIRAAFLAVVCTIVYYLFMRKHKYDFSNIMVDNKLQTITAVLVVTIITFINTLALFNTRHQGKIYIFIISALFAFVSIIMQYGMSSNKHREAELSLMGKILRDEKDRYEKEKENIELINIKCHDLRHQIAIYEDKLENEELKSISDAIMFYDMGIKTGNDALDMVLNEKKLVCQKHSIKFTCMLDGRRLNFVSAHEIYSLVGNAVENAINAAKDLPEEKRIISITDAGKPKLINIVIENYFEGNIIFFDGLPVTTQTTDYHGFGMKSMRYIVEKYGGALRSYVAKDIFRLEIFLPIIEV